MPEPRHQVRNKGMIPVVCKCPKSGQLHTVMMNSKPNIMPRIYAPEYEYLRNDTGEGSGYMKREKVRARGMRG